MWLAPEAIATWEAVGVGKHSGQLQYSDLAIEVALTLRLIFHLPLRQTEGFLTSIFRMLRLDLFVPDHTTLSRRGQHLDLALRRVPTGEGLHLIVDSTGLSIVGEGEWAAAKHGGQGTRGWKKLHLGVDRTGVILAQALTDPNVADATTAKDLRRSRCCRGKEPDQPWCGRPGRLGGGARDARRGGDGCGVLGDLRPPKGGEGRGAIGTIRAQAKARRRRDGRRLRGDPRAIASPNGRQAASG